MPDGTYMKIFLNRINEFKTYTLNSLKREEKRRRSRKIRRRRKKRKRRRRIRRRRKRKGGGRAIETTLSETRKGNNV
jgi:hypothetical protein